MKRLIFVFALSFFRLMSADVYATPLGDAIREADEGKVLIWNRCIYNVTFKDSGKEPVFKGANGTGNGFFFDHQYDNNPGKHLVLTAKHVIKCSDISELPDAFFNGFAREDVAAVTYKNSTHINFKGQIFAAELGNFDINNSEIDLAILEVSLPETIRHHHNLLMPDGMRLDTGDELVIRGYVPFNVDNEMLFEKGIRGWLTRLQFTHLERVTRDGLLLQLSTPAYSGQSGSAVYVYRNGKLYLAGIVVMSAWKENETIDTSWATLLKKEYFIPSKKP